MRGVLDLPPDLAPIADAVADALGRVETVFDAELASDLPPVDALCAHIERYRGKMLRPVLVCVWGLAADPSLGRLPDTHVTLAAVCEMVHMATLVHDDVLDEATVRRRGTTVNALRGNEAAVILGDYLIASAYRLCSTLPTPEPALLIGRASQVMCAGELLQLHHRDDLSLDEATYFEILERKTAELIATACELGAAASAGTSDARAAARTFGRSLGLAFQIQDDLLDLTGDEATVGKSVGKDLEKGKLTYPLIHHLGAADPATRGRTLQLLRDRTDAAGRTPELLARLRETGSVDAARVRAESLVGDARLALASLPDSPARRVLLQMADAVVTRSY
jgi:octaprenyl-diphosphate synthase